MRTTRHSLFFCLVFCFTSLLSSGQQRRIKNEITSSTINWDLLNLSSSPKDNTAFWFKPKSKRTFKTTLDNRWWGNHTDFDNLYNMGGNQNIPSARWSGYGTLYGDLITIAGVGTKYTSNELLEKNIYLNPSMALVGSWVSGTSLMIRGTKNRSNSRKEQIDQNAEHSDFYRLKLSRKSLGLSYHF